MLAETLPVDLQRALQSLTFTFRSVSPKSDPLAAEKCVAGIFAISALPAVPVTPHSSLITPAVPQPSTLNPQLSAFCAEVAALPAQQQVARVVAKLKEVNPGYDGQAKHKIEDGQVTELSLPGVTLTNIWPVRALAKLQEFDCCASTENRSKLADISPLAGLPLRHLALNATQVSDLSPVRTMPLVSLLCAATPVSDLSPLRGVSLMELDIAHTRVHDLSPLKGMTLESLSCNATETSDLSPLQGMPLRSLRAHYTRVQDLSPLQGTPLKELRFDQGLMRSPRNRDIVRGLTTLETINNQPAAEFWKKVEAGKMPDAAPAPTSVPVTRPPSLVTPAIPQPSTLDPQLSAFCAEVAALPAEQQVARVVAKLKELNPAWDGKEKHGIEGDAVVLFSLSPVNVTDISPVRALTRLRKLYCAAGSAAGGRSALADLRPLTGLLLTNICFNGTQVSNLSPLRGMPLAYLSCQAAPVNDLSPLQGMPLAHMDVGNTRVSDLSPLRGMTLESLSCNGTEIRDLSLLQGMPLQLLQVHHTRVQDLSPLQGTPLKELRFDQGLMSSQRNRDIVRGLTTLETINNQPAAEFWKKVDAGKMPDAAPAPTSVPVTRPPSLVTPAIPQPSTISPQPSDLSAFCAEVAALPPQEQVARVAAKLKELNPGFDGKETHKIEADKVTELAFSSVAVTNIVPVKALTGLKKLTLVPWSKGAKSALSNLSPLQGLLLTFLACGNTEAADLTPLKGMPLTILSVDNTPVADLAPLAGMPLTILWCNSTKVSDFSPVQAAPLQELKCDAAVAYSAANAATLRGIKTLAKINDLPAAMFWTRAGPAAATSLPAKSDQPQPPGVAVTPAEKDVGAASGLTLRATLEGHQGRVSCLAFSPDGKTLASGSQDMTIKLWDMATGKEKAVLKGHTHFVNQIVFWADGKTLASWSEDDTVRLWDLTTGQGKITLQVKEKESHMGVLSPDGQVFAVATRFGGVQPYSVATGSKRRSHFGKWDLHRPLVAFSPDGKTCSAWGPDGKQALIRWDRGETLGLISGVNDIICRLFSRDGKMLAMAGSAPGMMGLWDLEKRQWKLMDESYIVCLAFSYDGKLLAGSHHGATLLIWDTTKGKRLYEIKKDRDDFISLAFSPDGKTLATGSHRKTVSLWDVPR